jgi:hypothetical protein
MVHVGKINKLTQVKKKELYKQRVNSVGKILFVLPYNLMHYR